MSTHTVFTRSTWASFAVVVVRCLAHIPNDIFHRYLFVQDLRLLSTWLWYYVYPGLPHRKIHKNTTTYAFNLSLTLFSFLPLLPGALLCLPFLVSVHFSLCILLFLAFLYALCKLVLVRKHSSARHREDNLCGMLYECRQPNAIALFLSLCLPVAKMSARICVFERRICGNIYCVLLIFN